MNHVREGTAWSAVVIDTNFTDDLLKRICSIAVEKCMEMTGPNETFSVTEEIIEQSTVHLHSDLSSKSITAQCYYYFYVRSKVCFVIYH